MTENYISLKEMEQRRQGHEIVAAAIEAARLCPFGASAPTMIQAVARWAARVVTGDRMRRVAAVEAKLAGVFSDHAIDRVGVHVPACLVAFAVVLERPEQRPLSIVAVPRYPGLATMPVPAGTP